LSLFYFLKLLIFAFVNTYQFLFILFAVLCSSRPRIAPL
jgi:hypothetical protein